MSLALLGTEYVVGSVAVSCGGLALARRFVPAEKLRPHHDVAGFLIGIIGVLYTVLLAFVVIVAWEQFESAEEHASQEAASMLAVYRVARILPPDERLKLREELRNYELSVVSDEWPCLASGQMSRKTQTAADQVWETVLSRTPNTPMQMILLPHLVSRLNDMSIDRNTRLLDSRNGVPKLMWLVLVCGGLATIVFTYFFDIENRASQMAMTMIISGLIGLVLFLISAIDQPYTGEFKVYPDAMNSAKEEMDQIDQEDRQTALLRSKSGFPPAGAAAVPGSITYRNPGQIALNYDYDE
ncbi:MAG: hypothetical protein ACLQVD_18975 [Capsulimonadaceae bacterium]